MNKRLPILVLTGLVSIAIVHASPGDPVPRKYRQIQKYLNRATRIGLSGIAVYIETPKHGKWIGTAGYSNLEDRSLFQKKDIISMASIGKMYNAVAVMKLVEAGRLHLDDLITQYLPVSITNYLPSAKDVTVRHLLGHTSGFANYEYDSSLNRLYLSGRLKLDTLTHENALKRYAFGKASLNKPGVAFHYSSTNYVLLAMIVDRVVPEGHTAYLRNLLDQLKLDHTSYRQAPAQNNVRYYGDLNLDEVLEDVTARTLETTNWFIGDDGVYAPIEEAARFIQLLMHEKILNAQSLQEMKTGSGLKGDTGLGLTTDTALPYRLLYGHSGRGIGTTADLYYFPRQDITVVIFCNTGLRGAAPGLKKAYRKMRTKIVKKLFLF